ncbi:MAG: ParB/RepB/Spo0J family partition protein [Chloroflexi bacterium]|nr:ParB/RepB/Spo0J family partition protein [Chloroflexota bacterium]
MKNRSALGRGLAALIPQEGEPAAGMLRVPLKAIVPNPYQPRQHFDEDELQQLADSIREMGLIQPLIVQRTSGPEGPATYQLIAGERRLRAAQMAGLREVDVILKEATPLEMLELALVENIQRSELNPLEQASAYRQLADEFGMTQERIAERVGRSRESVANTLRLLRLPDTIKELLQVGQIQPGHAIALLALDDADEQELISRQIVKRQLSVRQAEELVRRFKAAAGPRERRPRSPETEALEESLRNTFNTKVELYRSRKGGKVVLYYYSDEELDALYNRLVNSEPATSEYGE